MTDVVATTERHPLPDGQVQLLGAVDTVTGAMTRVETAGKALLVDCGIGQGKEASRWSFPEGARDVDAVLLTHGHYDHIGSLPALLEGGFDKPILATRPTLDIARISLEDSLGMNGASPAEIRGFIQRLMQLARPIHYDELGPHLDGFDGRVAFHEAGHILGSASVEVWSDKSRVIVSGDLGRPDSPILPDFCTEWSAEAPVDVVVLESTYGGREHAHTHDDVQLQLEKILLRAIEKRGRVLVPSFAIGRTQTLLYFLNTLAEAGRIKGLPVAVDTPMGLVVTETYKRFEQLFDKEALGKLQRGDDPLNFEDLYAVRKGSDSRRLREVEGPIVIIAGSGMCTGGRIVGHLKDGLPDEKTTVMFVGYQAPGTPGRRIQEAAARGGRVRIDGEEVPVRAEITTLRGLSAHADRGELLGWLKEIPGVRRVALHHGDSEAQQGFVQWTKAKL
jgi:metallo-beta-lactamase family protein